MGEGKVGNVGRERRGEGKGEGRRKGRGEKEGTERSERRVVYFLFPLFPDSLSHF